MSQLLRRLCLAGLFVLSTIVPAIARDVAIAWDANTEPDVAGYVVRYGTAPGAYGVSVDVGNRTDWTLTPLEPLRTYYVAVEAYSSVGLRSALSTELTINPDYSVCAYGLNATSATFGAALDTPSVDVTAQAGCNWSASSYASWITIVSRSAVSGNGTVALKVAANSSLATRVGAVIIAGKTYMVTQSGLSCSLSVSAESNSPFTRAGGTGLVTVTASPAQCTWVVASDATWLTFSGAASRVGSGSVAYSVAANAGAARVGHLSVAGQPIEVAQVAYLRLDALEFDAKSADVFLYNQTTGTWGQYAWDGGGFSGMASGVSSAGLTALPADFNRDDRSDLFLYDAATGIWARGIADETGQLTFHEAVWQAGWAPTILDLNGDGRSDIFFYDKRTGAWVEWITQPATYEFVERSGTMARGWTVYRAVLDADGRDDLFLYNGNPKKIDRNSGKWARAFTQADLSFTVMPGATVWSAGASMLPMDFSGDGLSEVFVLSATGRWSVVTFTAKTATLKSGQWSAGWLLARGEFNADGIPDLFLYNRKNGQWRICLRKGSGFTILRGAWARNLEFGITDLNADGVSDVVVYDSATGTWGAASTGAKAGAFGYAGGSFGGAWKMLASHSTRP